jgi:hypothetical protein
MNGSVLWSGAAKPVCEMAGAEQRVLARDEAALLKRRAEVVGLLVPHDRAGVVMRHELLAHDFVKRDSVGAGQFNGSIQRLRHGDFSQVSGEVVREDGLKQRDARWTVCPLVASSAMRPTNSKNCVARTIV